MTNVNVNIEQVLPQAGSDNRGRRLGTIEGVAMAAQNDTLTLVNADLSKVWSIIDDTTGATVPFTVASNVITLTGSVTGAKSLLVTYT